MKKFFVSLSLVISSLLMSSPLCASVVYIRSDGLSFGDGQSWETAFNSIDAALANLQQHPDQNTFWVAAGVYSPITIYAPSGVPGGALGDNNPFFPIGFLTYNLPDGVKIYGGFKGNEKQLSDRPMIPNPILESGNKRLEKGKAPKEVPDFALTVLDGGPSQSWHVVTVGNDIAQTGANVALFDLTIRGGYADGPDKGELDKTPPPEFIILSIDYAHDTGGGIYARFGSTVDLFNVQFSCNACSSIFGGDNGNTIAGLNQPILPGGGGIAAMDDNTVVNVDNCYFFNNSSIGFGGGGGAIQSIFNSTLNLRNSILSDNISNRTGGAIRSKDAGDVTVSGCFFKGNIAEDLNIFLDEGGGAIDIIDANLFVDHSTFIANNGMIGGGAIFFHAPFDDGTPYFLDVNHCDFKNNIAGPLGGGAIFVFGITPHVGSLATIRHSHFSKNRGMLGGALYITGMNTEIKDNRFVNNLADAWGGAIAIDNNFDTLVVVPTFPFPERPVTHVKDCTFISNKTRGVQPPSFGFPPVFTTPGFLNVVFSVAPFVFGTPAGAEIDQTIQSGGGAITVLFAGVADIKNSTFRHNDAINGTGGAILVGGGTGTVFFDDTTTQTLDYAFATVKCCKFKDNCPNNAVAVDLAGVGTGPDGVTLIIEECKSLKNGKRN